MKKSLHLSSENGLIMNFSGTAKDEKSIRIASADPGKPHDIAELEINGQYIGVLRSPPTKRI